MAGPPLDLGAPRADELASIGADLARLAEGGERAFETLWRRFQPALAVLLAGKFRASIDPALRPRLDDEIEDILQETAISAFSKLREFRYRGPGSLLAWLSTIATRAGLDRVDYWKAGKRHPRLERALPGEGSSSTSASPGGRPIAHTGRGPSSEAALEERRRQVAEVLGGLSDRHHQIVFLRFFAGADWNEVAELVGSPSGEAVAMECVRKVFPEIAARLARQRQGGPG
ncbi:MAG: hypothetical protein L0323_21590 [Planctomycetes bacterium]|nr:hypothetical protein [Planctomycetota bacterium]